MNCGLRNRQGLTLLELVVVMVILVALAGILVPMLPNMLGKSHSAAHATNVGELCKVFETYNLTNRGYPDGLDALIASDALFNKLPGYASTSGGGSGTACGGEIILDSVGLTSAELGHLNEAGITTLYQMDNATTDATFASYTSPLATITLAGPTAGSGGGSGTPGTKLAVLSDAAKARLFTKGVTTTDKYVVFGVGRQCKAVGRGGMAEAPVHFFDEAGDAGNPTKTYARYAVVFNASADPAEFAGVVGLHGSEVTGLEGGLAEFYAGHGH
jgi:prepilin-type N-terminal cleavage/methylation domain-containing protein